MNCFCQVSGCIKHPSVRRSSDRPQGQEYNHCIFRPQGGWPQAPETGPSRPGNAEQQSITSPAHHSPLSERFRQMKHSFPGLVVSFLLAATNGLAQQVILNDISSPASYQQNPLLGSSSTINTDLGGYATAIAVQPSNGTGELKEISVVFAGKDLNGYTPDFSRFNFAVDFWDGLTAFANAPIKGNMGQVSLSYAQVNFPATPYVVIGGYKPLYLLTIDVSSSHIKVVKDQPATRPTSAFWSTRMAPMPASSAVVTMRRRISTGTDW